MAERVWLATRNLLFRPRLRAVVAAAGGAVSRDATGCEVAVVDLSEPEWEQRVRELRARNVTVLAFGPHVDTGALRRARALGAEAVPNSRVERRLAELLAD